MIDLFNTEKNCELNNIDAEWVGMPEFVQEKQEPFAKIIFRFETQKDLDDFAKLIGQKLTPKTKSAWFPYKSHFRSVKKEWTLENES